MCFQNEKDTEEVRISPPYSASMLGPFRNIDKTDPIFDRWSIGVVILEIIAGKALVHSAYNYIRMLELVEQCSKYLDKETVDLLNFMLFSKGLNTIDRYVNESLVKQPKLVLEAMRGMKQAILDDELLNMWQREGKKLLDQKTQPHLLEEFRDNLISRQK